MSKWQNKNITIDNTVVSYSFLGHKETFMLMDISIFNLPSWFFICIWTEFMWALDAYSLLTAFLARTISLARILQDSFSPFLAASLSDLFTFSSSLWIPTNSHFYINAILHKLNRTIQEVGLQYITPIVNMVNMYFIYKNTLGWFHCDYFTVFCSHPCHNFITLYENIYFIKVYVITIV